jgi:preprotein translocase subunit SecB
MSSPEENENSQPEAGAEGNQFSIQKIYVKDISFETPNSPDTFRMEWRPDVDIQLQNEAKVIEADLIEVVLRITVTANIGDKAAFLVEVNQAGIFHIKGPSKQEMEPILGSYCPSILFPYARELISDLVTRGGFPQFLLAPVNFDALLAKHLQEQQARGEGQASDAVH